MKVVALTDKHTEDGDLMAQEVVTYNGDTTMWEVTCGEKLPASRALYGIYSTAKWQLKSAYCGSLYPVAGMGLIRVASHD